MYIIFFIILKVYWNLIKWYNNIFKMFCIMFDLIDKDIKDVMIMI